MIKNSSFKIYSVALISSILISPVRNNLTTNNANILNVFSVANASSNIKYVKLNNTNTALSLRKEPSLNSKTKNGNSNFLGNIKSGEAVRVLSTSTISSDNIEWVQVSFNNVTGWIDSSKLISGNMKIGSAVTNSLPRKEVSISKNSYLEVRSSATTKQDNIVGRLKNGDIVEVIQETNHWYKINKGFVSGWVSKSYLKDIATTDKVDVIKSWSHKDDETSIYIKQIREYSSDIYIANIKIKNPSQFKHVYADNNFTGVKKTVENMTKKYNPVLAINSNGFDQNGLLCGTVGSNGKINQFVSNSTSVVMDYDGVLNVVNPQSKDELESLKPFWVTTFGPTLVEDYKIVQEHSIEDTQHPRVAIAQKDKANEFIIIVADGRSLSSKGLTLYELATLFEREGARVAYNLDGGGSSTLVFKGDIINKPSDLFGPRKVADALIVTNLK